MSPTGSINGYASDNSVTFGKGPRWTTHQACSMPRSRAIRGVPLISYEGDKINAKALEALFREAVDLNTSD